MEKRSKILIINLIIVVAIKIKFILNISLP